MKPPALEQSTEERMNDNERTDERMKQELLDEQIDTQTVRFVTTKEAMRILCCSRPAASRAIHLTNERLKKQGCYTMRGRCNRQAFLETIGYR